MAIRCSKVTGPSSAQVSTLKEDLSLPLRAQSPADIASVRVPLGQLVIYDVMSLCAAVEAAQHVRPRHPVQQF